MNKIETCIEILRVEKALEKTKSDNLKREYGVHLRRMLKKLETFKEGK